MKTNKIPKRHSQLNLPDGTRVRYSTAAMRKSKNKVLMTGHIHPGKELPRGWYWIRPLNRFVARKVKANRIKFIEYIPGAPQPPRPCPPCPKPQARKIVSGFAALADELMHPTNPPVVAVIDPPNFENQQLKRELAKLTAQPLAKVLERVRLAITLGDVDKDLDQLAERIQARRKVIRKMKATKLLAKLSTGDQVTISNKAKPKYMAGAKGRVTGRQGTKVLVTFDKPLRRFGKCCTVPAALLTKD